MYVYREGKLLGIGIFEELSTPAPVYPIPYKHYRKIIYIEKRYVAYRPPLPLCPSSSLPELIQSKRWIFFMDPRRWEGFMNKSFMNCSCCTGRIDVAFPPRHPAQYLGFTPTWCSWAVLARYRRPVSRFKSLEPFLFELRWTGLK